MPAQNSVPPPTDETDRRGLGDDLLITSELYKRKRRSADHQAENLALVALARTMAEPAEIIFQMVAETACRLCGADAAGVTCEEQQNGQSVLRWVATAGEFAPLAQSMLAGEGSPCGVALKKGTLILVRQPEEFFKGLPRSPRPIEEMLVVPFHRQGRPVGTLWIVALDRSARFDSEDARIMTSLSAFAEAAQLMRPTAPSIGLPLEPTDPSGPAAQLETHSEMIRVSTAMFRVFFDKFPLYAGMLDRAGRVIEVGQSALVAGGFRKADIIGKFFWDTGWWTQVLDSRARLLAAFPEVLAGQHYTATLAYNFADGTERQVDFSMLPVSAGSDGVDFVIATGYDISERIAARNELVATQQRLDSALIAGDIGTYDFDTVNGLIYGDANFARIFSLPDIGGQGTPIQSMLEAVAPQDRDDVSRKVAHSVATGDEFSADYRVVALGERWFNGRGRAVRDLDGQVRRFQGVVMDVTERKAAENALRESEERYRTLFNSIDEGFCSVEVLFNAEGRPVDHRFLEVNPAFERHSGIKSPKGKTASELLPRLERYWHELYGRVATTGEAVRVENYVEELRRWFNVYISRLGGDSSRKIVIVFNEITARKLAETALRRSEERAKNIVESIADGFITMDREWRITYINPRGAEIVRPIQRTSGSQIGKILFEAFPGLAGTIFEDNFRRALREQVTVAFESHYPPLERWFDLRAYPSREGVSIYFLDITERKNAEAARAEAQRLFERQNQFIEAVFSSINDFAYLFDLAGRFQFVNRSLLALWGLRLEEAIGKNFHQLHYPPALADKLAAQIDQVIRSKQPLSDETAYIGASGHYGYYHYIFTPVLGSDGAVEFVAGLTRDITERKETEGRDRLLVAIDDATRPLTNPRQITQSSAQLLGDYLRVDRCAYGTYDAAIDSYQLIGDHCRGVDTIVGCYQLADFGNDCLQSFMQGNAVVVNNVETDPRTAEHREGYRRLGINGFVTVPLIKEGRFVAGMAIHSAAPRVWQPGEVELLQLVANRCWESIERTRAVRELAEAHRKLEDHARVLELRVAERTSTLQETVSELEAFSYSISHDLRGPLRSMRSFAQALQEDCGPSIDAVGTDYIRRIVSASERMDRIIQDVLVFSRIARNELVLEAVQLAEFIPSLIEGYPQFDDGSAKIIIRHPLPGVMANRAALTQCFSNLIGNAVKFVASGVFPCVEISGQVVAERARIFVKDNGIGLEPSVRDKIFGAFYRLDDRYPGTGIGLAIVKKAVERMGGYVGVESEPGAGSTFYLDLTAAPLE